MVLSIVAYHPSTPVRLQTIRMSSTSVGPTDRVTVSPALTIQGHDVGLSPASVGDPPHPIGRRVVLHLLMIIPWIVLVCSVFGIVATLQNGSAGEDSSYCA